MRTSKSIYIQGSKKKSNSSKKNYFIYFKTNYFSTQFTSLSLIFYITINIIHFILFFFPLESVSISLSPNTLFFDEQTQTQTQPHLTSIPPLQPLVLLLQLSKPPHQLRLRKNQKLSPKITTIGPLEREREREREKIGRAHV